MKTNTQNPKTKPANPQTSWADRVRVSNSSTRFTLEPLSRQPVGGSFKITEEMLLENFAQWKRCMISFFPGFKMPFHAVNSIASRAWCSYGLENIMTTSKGFIIFRFNTEDEMHIVLEKGPWMFGGKTIILQQWHPRFQFDKSKISTLPVWIRLHGLPFPLWSKQGLSLAASMVRRPLFCDELTYTCTRLEYARLCVEVDAALPFVHNFEIDSPLSIAPLTVTIDYECKPLRCGKCNVFGHSCASSASFVETTVTATDYPITTSPHSLPPTLPNVNPSTIPTNAPLSPHHLATSLVVVANPSTHLISQPQINPLTLPTIEIEVSIHLVAANPTDMEEGDSSQDSGNELLGLQHHHLNTLHATLCLESKMDSIRTTSETASTAQEVSAKASTSIHMNDHQVQSSPPTPTTVRKKKGGRKKKEARGL
ncbi:hypothetical protein NC653_022297 [Populus alba x Populus x berolinensis]|uniref:DUF4283 domain-containing protein n=1 Tax=Populus alba x Populus x berolinensis TaxID=444605 RepID=A0AAD6MGT5_9ROSI|nr:hypothetical protein NC653_022297 [Populus alba x Populus x berolinensis]